LTKQGNKWLRWGFIEAVTPAGRSSDFIREHYMKVKKSPWCQGCTLFDSAKTR
jgi:hypothetical protein